MKKICVITGTRAEYGVLKHTLLEIKKSKTLELKLIVTGTHLSKDFGYTINEIKEDGFYIDESIPILMNERSKDGIAKEMGLFMIQLSQVFQKLEPDMLIILGDRYEMLAAASTAMVMNIPIAHISGGEITEGSIDDPIRHSITKMSHIHFPGADIYGKNIINMGEEPWRVFNIGDPGIENIKKTNFLTKEEIKKELDVEVDENTLLVTYHPVTLEIDMLHYQIDNLLNAIIKLNKNTIITYPNADNGGEYIINRLEELKDKYNNIHVFKNLGSRKYLSIMKLCGTVVGNSSSALIEAPFLKIPVVNIGERQKGRLMAENIICCSNQCDEIVKAINKSLSSEFKEKVKNTKSLYGEGDTSREIVKILEDITIDDKLLKKKLVWS
ncbi:MAG: UDP-N-acetylglucosamine 2-epimerase [Clostridiaceae bacterium]